MTGRDQKKKTPGAGRRMTPAIAKAQKRSVSAVRARFAGKAMTQAKTA